MTPKTIARMRRGRPARSKLSKPLRRRRLLRGIAALILGMVWSTCAMILAVQLGWVSYFDQGPLVLGIVFGALSTLALTVLQMTARRLRILFVPNRIATLALIVALLLPITLATGASPAFAAQPLGTCEVSASGPGLFRDDVAVSAPLRMESTTEDNPLVVRPDQLDVVEVVWNIDSDAELAGKQWWVKTEVTGVDVELFSAEGERDQSTYLVSDLPSSIQPGLYRVWGEFEGVCRTQFGYIRVDGSPLGNRQGQIATILLPIALIASITFARRSRLDVWSMTTPDGVTVDIVDHERGRIVRGPLVPGQTYHARVSIDFPDRPEAYDRFGVAPLEVMVGVLGASAAPETGTISPRSGGNPSTQQPFTVPDQGKPFDLVVDVGASGNPLDSVRLAAEPTSTGELRIQSATGSLLYQAGTLSARHLASVATVDSTLYLHGDRLDEYFEVWTMAGDKSLRVPARHRVEIAALESAADTYRFDLETAIRSWGRAESDEARFEALRSLAYSGSILRNRAIGDLDSASPADGNVLIAPDLATMHAMTFPWAGLYQGEVGAGPDVALCAEFVGGPSKCDDHDETTICPNLFWGFRHELSWPSGWIRNAAATEPSVSPLRRLARSIRRIHRSDLLPNRLENAIPARVVAVNPQSLASRTRLDELDGPFALEVVRANDSESMKDLHWSGGNEADLVYFFCHGVLVQPSHVDPAVDVAPGGFSLKLEKTLDGAALNEVFGGLRFDNGPLVFINACRSGVIALRDHHGLIDALVHNGARAIVVTETRVGAREAAVGANAILERVLSGTRVSRAIVEARREDLLTNGRLSMLTYSYYGPPGLHLTRPPIAVVDARGDATVLADA